MAETLTHHAIRRLAEATSFSGELVCSFDPKMPLNITDLTQPFKMKCESPPGMNGWLILLIVVGAIAGVVVLCALYGALEPRYTAWKIARYRKREQEVIAAAEAARNDYVLDVDLVPTPPTNASQSRR